VVDENACHASSVQVDSSSGSPECGNGLLSAGWGILLVELLNGWRFWRLGLHCVQMGCGRSTKGTCKKHGHEHSNCPPSPGPPDPPFPCGGRPRRAQRSERRVSQSTQSPQCVAGPRASPPLQSALPLAPALPALGHGPTTMSLFP
jgi:hypothetical protein